MNERPTRAERLAALMHAHNTTNDDTPEPPRNWLLDAYTATRARRGNTLAPTPEHDDTKGTTP